MLQLVVYYPRRLQEPMGLTLNTKSYLVLINILIVLILLVLLFALLLFLDNFSLYPCLYSLFVPITSDKVLSGEKTNQELSPDFITFF
jgi:hypothetical protein